MELVKMLSGMAYANRPERRIVVVRQRMLRIHIK